MRYTLFDAFQKLVDPNAQWGFANGDRYENLIWMSGDSYTQPTEEECVQKLAELNYEYEVKEYQRQRAREYPLYADQFDQIFHEGIDAWKATILEVKRRYPKQVMEPEVLEERKRQALADLEASRAE